jgi:hypothetical protein
MPQAVEVILHFNVRNRGRILYARGANNNEFGQTCKNNLRAYVAQPKHTDIIAL